MKKRKAPCVCLSLFYIALFVSSIFVGCSREECPFASFHFTSGEVAMIGGGGETAPRALETAELERVKMLLAELELYENEVVETMLYGGANEGFYLKDENDITHILRLEPRDDKIILHWDQYWDGGSEIGNRYYAESEKAQALIDLCRELLAAKRQPASPFAQVQIVSAVWYHDEARQYVLTDTERAELVADMQACVTYGTSLGELPLPQEHSGYLILMDTAGGVIELRGFSSTRTVINGIQYESNDALFAWDLFCREKWILYRNAA